MARKSKGLTREQRAEINRQNGLKGGRPLGSRDILPRGSIDALKSMRFRVKHEYQGNEHACELAGDGLDAIVKVMHGRVHSRRAPSVLKAAVQLRAEICEPVVTESKITGSLSLSAAVADANARIAANVTPVPLPAHEED